MWLGGGLTDNVTHTLIGIAAIRSAEPRVQNKPQANLLLWTSIIANNLPDLDALLSLGTHGPSGQLFYLVTHRGLSHSLLAVPILGVVSALLASGIVRTGVTFKSWIWGMLGILLHLFADSWNEYGVKPFSPFLDRWFFGDSVFILEPILWFTLLPIALWTLESKVVRAIFAGLGIFALVSLWSGQIAPPWVAATDTLFVVVLFLAYWKNPHPRWVTALALVLVLGLGAMSFGVKKSISSQIASLQADAEERIELLVSPSPGNPLCWRTLVSSHVGDEYRVRGGTYSLGSVPEKVCRFRTPKIDEMTAPVVESSWKGTEHLSWVWEFRGSLKELAELRRISPELDSFLGFARFPYWKRISETEVKFGDLRFDRRRGFAQFVFPLAERGPASYPDTEGSLPKFFQRQ